MQILVVEDDPAVSQSVALMLQSDTCTVDAAALGQEGVELAKLDGYDIILLDLDLPDLSGYEVLRALRAAGIDTPVLILSGLSTVANKTPSCVAPTCRPNWSFGVVIWPSIWKPTGSRSPGSLSG